MKDFYPTWQEASRAAIALGMDSPISYDHRLDNRLHSNPNVFYKDFPGWKEFLGIAEVERYPTWKEASVAAIDMYIYTEKVYQRKCSQDSKLPPDPRHFYKDFPGWKVFLGQKLTEKARNYVK